MLTPMQRIAILIVAAVLGAVALGQAGLHPEAVAAATSTVSANGAQHVALYVPDCRRGYYKNTRGHCVRRPSRDPIGATAKCADGTYSYSEHASGTCSYHGGVARWIHHP